MTRPSSTTATTGLCSCAITAAISTVVASRSTTGRSSRSCARGSRSRTDLADSLLNSCSAAALVVHPGQRRVVLDVPRDHEAEHLGPAEHAVGRAVVLADDQARQPRLPDEAGRGQCLRGQRDRREGLHQVTRSHEVPSCPGTLAPDRGRGRRACRSRWHLAGWHTHRSPGLGLRALGPSRQPGPDGSRRGPSPPHRVPWWQVCREVWSASEFSDPEGSSMPARHTNRILGPGSWSESTRIAEILRKETVGGALLLLDRHRPGLGQLPWPATPTRPPRLRRRPGGAAPAPALGTWAADGLLAIFFFVVGLELKREFVAGDLRDPAPRRGAHPGRPRRRWPCRPSSTSLVNLSGGGGALRAGRSRPPPTSRSRWPSWP